MLDSNDCLRFEPSEATGLPAVTEVIVYPDHWQMGEKPKLGCRQNEIRPGFSGPMIDGQFAAIKLGCMAARPMDRKLSSEAFS